MSACLSGSHVTMSAGFRPFTLAHALALAAIAAAAWLFVIYASRQDADRRQRTERTLAALIALFWLCIHGWWLAPSRFDLATRLPIHVCNVMSLVATISLVMPRRLPRALVYFWGLGVSTQALLTPVLREPMSSVWFWTFWVEHAFVVSVAVYDLTVRRYRPTWRDYGLACGAGFAYLAVVLPIDIALTTDYGFVGAPKPLNPSLLDLLGPWPQRIIFIVMLVAVGMAALMLPWEIANAVKRRRAQRFASSHSQ